MMHDIVYKLSEEDYLEGEKTSVIKYEYVAGEVFAMSGASKAHAAISLNIGSALRAHLRGKPCRAYVSDMKVRVKTCSAYYYPDVVATCSPGDIAVDAPAYYLEAPKLIVEVLSDSTARTDRREKLMAYQQLESLVECLLVDQGKREVEVYFRTPQGWRRDIYSSGEIIALQSMNLALPMDLVYEDSGVN